MNQITPTPADVPVEAPGVAALNGVSETLLIPLAARARGSAARSVADFTDPTAEMLCRRFQVDMIRYAAHWPTVRGTLLRGAWCDARCIDFLSRHPEGTVLNVGAGLNTAYERVAARVPDGGWRWIDSDVASVMALRETVFDDDARRASRVLDATDATALAQLLSGIDGPLLMLAEGVLMYLPPPAIHALFSRLADHPGAEAVFDWCSPAMVRRSRRHPALARIRDSSVVFQWALLRPENIADHDPRWRVVDQTNAPISGAGRLPAAIGALHRLLTGGREFYGCAHIRAEATAPAA
ncbi:class I SAM-dependent methyltransferase [Roseospirillum parvum]|uniref:O-Methyltransferase involved in polyketide biosynthesis n=1 Tax=Roseospirillum parvum TaxID=83401 RepID=A0A1G7ZIE1_9PROT|nr:class I SAM-dependent methyltransferase [Roseospirillum parvum]SDH08444.1 O-Methyltransferase involved in polyketide biosynthesis [Roseospirillum parvum]